MKTGIYNMLMESQIEGWGFKPDLFLRDYPQHAFLFKRFNIHSEMNLAVDVPLVSAIMRGAFEAELSFHLRGRMREDLKNAGKPYEGVCGDTDAFMIRYGEVRNKYLVALSTGTHSNPNANVVDISNCLHAYGHYVEERHQSYLHSKGERIPHTSLFTAFQWLNKHCPDIDLDNKVHAANEILAWTNAIWLCWLFFVDRRHVITGLANLTAANRAMDTGYEIKGLLKAHAQIMDRSAANDFFSNGGKECGFDGFFNQGTEDSRCLQIDRATIRLIQTIM